MNEVKLETERIIKTSPSVEKLVSEMKNIVFKSVSHGGITVDDAVLLSAKLIVMASMI